MGDDDLVKELAHTSAAIILGDEVRKMLVELGEDVGLPHLHLRLNLLGEVSLNSLCACVVTGFTKFTTLTMTTMCMCSEHLTTRVYSETLHRETIQNQFHYRGV